MFFLNLIFVQCPQKTRLLPYEGGGTKVKVMSATIMFFLRLPLIKARKQWHQQKYNSFGSHLIFTPEEINNGRRVYQAKNNTF